MSQVEGKIIILIGPSGVGKSSFIERVLKEEPAICDLITYTTRKPRAGEKEGDPYHFVSLEKFEELKKNNFFVETAKVHDNFYGTPWDQIRNAWAKNKVIIMDVDVQGARVFKRVFPKALTIFLAPPTIDALRQRILARGSVSNIEVRMQTAANEMKAAGEFSHHLVNDDFEVAYGQFRILIENLLKNQ
jgi:guanylate kinase